MVWVPRVAMKGGTFSLEMMRPLTRPKAAPTAITTRKATGMLNSGQLYMRPV